MTHRCDTLFMTHRIEPLFKNHFSIWLKVLNSSNNSKNWTFFFITPRIELFSLNLTQRFEPFFWIWRKALNMTQRIEPLFEYDSKNWISFWVWFKESNFFFEYDSMNRTHFFECDSKIEILVEKIVKKFKMFFYMSRRIRPAFFNMTQRIEPFSIWLKDLIYSVWHQELNFFFEYDSMNRSHFFECDSKIEIFGWKSQKWIFSIFWKLKIDSFHMTRRIEPAFSTWLRELNYFWNWLKVFLMDSKNRTLFQYDSTNRTFLKCDSFFKMIQRTEPLFGVITQRIGLDSKTWTRTYFDDSQTWSFFLELCHKEFFLKKMTQRIGPKFLTQRYVFLYGSKKIFLYDSKNWFFCMTQRIETFFFEYDTENWTLFLFCRKELKLFPLCRKWLSFFFQKFYWLKELNFFFSDMTQRNEIRKKKKTQRVEFFLIWLTELNLFFFH